MSASAAPHSRRSPTRRSPIRRGRPGDDRGSASIEFAITAVAVMAIIFTAIQAACWFWARSIALAAAQEGADAQRVYHAAPAAGQTKAAAFIASAGDSLTGTNISVTGDARQVQVTVTGHCLSIIPGFCNAFPVSATIHGTRERPT